MWVSGEQAGLKNEHLPYGVPYGVWFLGDEPKNHEEYLTAKRSARTGYLAPIGGCRTVAECRGSLIGYLDKLAKMGKTG